jgi:peptidoglycan/xylan/chitin deacetylase (PgdA/CDA1 family)
MKMHTVYKCFPGGKHKALTMSYDDGKLADRKLVEIFNRYGIKGTFHLNAGSLGSQDRIAAEEVKTLYTGHEVAAHTFTHPVIARCPTPQIIQQIITDRITLEKIVEYPVRGLSYPYGSYNQAIKDILPHLGIEYARIVGSSKAFSLPTDFWAWESTCHHNHDLMSLAENFITLQKARHLYLMYVWGHSYEFDRDHNWNLIESFCEYIGNSGDIWYATNIEIIDYLKAFDNLKFSAAGDLVYNPSVLTLWLMVDEKVVEVPGGLQKSLY